MFKGKKILVIAKEAGFEAETELYVWKTALLLQDNGAQLYGAFQEKRKDADKYLIPFKDNFNIMSIPDLDYDMVAVHDNLEYDTLKMILERFKEKAVFFIHDHKCYCPKGSKRPSSSWKTCTNPYSALKCGMCCLGSGKLPAGIFSFSKKLELIKCFKNIVVSSCYMRDNLLMNGFFPSSLHVIPPNVTIPEKFTERVDPMTPIILYVGVINRDSGCDLFFDVLSRLQNKFTAKIIGEVEDTKIVDKKVSAYELGNKVQFLGWRNPPYKDYLKCDMAILPWRTQPPIGITAMAVSAWGLPVVSFDSGGLREAIQNGQTGFLVPAGDIDAMVAKSDQLLSDCVLRKKMSRKGFEFISERFSPEKYLNSFDRLMSSIDN